MSSWRDSGHCHINQAPVFRAERCIFALTRTCQESLAISLLEPERTLQTEKWAQRGKVTCLMSHSGLMASFLIPSAEFFLQGMYPVAHFTPHPHIHPPTHPPTFCQASSMC